MINAARDGRNAAVKQAARSAAITGAGSGLGHDIAWGLAERGYRVFGNASSEAKAQDLKSGSAGRARLVFATSPGSRR
jgi:NAD(P)-dependent dehydrogenase (short-subunit alcohol dehydrogenase family)